MSNPQPRLIVVTGCDDNTQITIPLTDKELATLNKVADALNEASTRSCQPNMRVSQTDQIPEHACTQAEWLFCDTCTDWGANPL